MLVEHASPGWTGTRTPGPWPARSHISKSPHPFTRRLSPHIRTSTARRTKRNQQLVRPSHQRHTHASPPRNPRSHRRASPNSRQNRSLDSTRIAYRVESSVTTASNPGHAAGIHGSTTRKRPSRRIPRMPSIPARYIHAADPVYHVQPAASDMWRDRVHIGSNHIGFDLVAPDLLGRTRVIDRVHSENRAAAWSPLPSFANARIAHIAAWLYWPPFSRSPGG